MAEPVIKVVGVSRIYHVGDVDVHALNNVSLERRVGESFFGSGSMDEGGGDGAANHDASGSLAGEEGALEIDRQRVVKVLFAHVFGEVAGSDAGVVDEYIELPEMMDGVVNGASDLLEAGHIHLQR